MNLIINGHKISTIVLISFIVSIILVPVMRKLAFHINAVNEPNARRLNKVPMPTLGGLAIFLSFLMGYILFADKSNQMLSILIGGFILILMGIFDDINPLKSRYKLVVQIIAAAIVVFYGNIVLNNVDAFGINLNFGIFSELVTILFILGIINAINLIDGMDGLAGGISSIYFLTIAVIAFILNKMGGLDVVLSLIMLGATLGFLFYNFPPALLYMGDTGSNFLGFIIAVTALLGFKNVTLTSLIIPVVILAIPILDTACAIGRRILKHKPLGEADKEHLHHQLLKMKFSTRKSVLIIYAINIIFSSVTIFYVLGNRYIAMGLYGFLMVILLFLVIRTDILFDHSSKETNKKKIKLIRKKK